jgi:F0F1-type ATP synthase membrane subunit b/b'
MNYRQEVAEARRKRDELIESAIVGTRQTIA